MVDLSFGTSLLRDLVTLSPFPINDCANRIQWSRQVDLNISRTRTLGSGFGWTGKCNRHLQMVCSSICELDCVLCVLVCVTISVLPIHKFGSVCWLCVCPVHVCIHVCSKSVKGPGVWLLNDMNVGWKGLGMTKQKNRCMIMRMN